MIARTVVLIALLAPAGCGPATDDARPAAADSGDRLPDVEIVGLDDGASISLAAFDGPAVVNLWATWCAPCRREIPDFEAVHRARGDEVRFVGINIGDDADDATAFLAEVGATYDQYLDPEGFVVTELRTTTMPVTLVLDADGAISTKHLGPMDQDALNRAIDDAIAG